MQNGLIERFIGRQRDERLNEHMLPSYRKGREVIENWSADYNIRRPHSSLDGLTLMEFVTRSRSDHNETHLTH